MKLTFLGKYLIPALIFSILIFWEPSLHADDCDEMPGPYTASFSMSRNGKTVGSMQVVLERIGVDHFSYRMDTALKWGILPVRTHQHSSLKLKNGQVLPLNFRSNQSISLYKRSEFVDFNWQSMQAEGHKKHADYELELTPGLQDKLSHYLLLARALCAGDDTVNFDVVSGPVPKHYVYKVQNTEILETSLGVLETLHVSRGTDVDEKQTDMWHAKETRFMPVKLIYRDKKRLIRMDLLEISFGNSE